MGRSRGGGIAFRTYAGELSNTAWTQVERAATKAGFTFDFGRCSWTARKRDADRRLIAELEARNFAPVHGGFWSKEG